MTQSLNRRTIVAMDTFITIHVVGESISARFHAFCAMTTMPIAAARTPKAVASGMTQSELRDSHPNVASMYGIALASCSTSAPCA